MDDIAWIAKPQPIAVERARARRPLADDPGQPVAVARQECTGGDTARRRNEDPGTPAGTIDQPGGKPAGRLRRCVLDRAHEEGQATLGRLVQGRRGELGWRDGRPGFARRQDPSDGRPDLELAVRVGERAGHHDSGSARRSGDPRRKTNEDPAAPVADGEQRRAARPSGLRRHDGVDGHGRADRTPADVRERHRRRSGRRRRGRGRVGRCARGRGRPSASARRTRSGWPWATRSGCGPSVGDGGAHHAELAWIHALEPVAARSRSRRVALAERSGHADGRAPHRGCAAERLGADDRAGADRSRRRRGARGRRRSSSGPRPPGR